MASLIERILRTGEKRTLKRLRKHADAVNSVEDDFKNLTDAELRAETDCLVAISNCPEDHVSQINGGRCTPMRLQVFADAAAAQAN